MDYDLIVVGGGPAGLTAAVRAAWLAAPEAHYRARIMVLEASDKAGGLSRWQPLVINTPGVFFTKRELNSLLKACSYFDVDIRYERVTALRVTGDGCFEVVTKSGTYHSLAAIIATGCRLGYPGESRHFHRKRIRWFPTNSALDQMLAEFEASPDVNNICLCGAEAVAATRRYIGSKYKLAIRTWAEPPYFKPPEVSVERGSLLGIDGSSERKELNLEFQMEDGSKEVVQADTLLVDFNAYEATAVSTQFLEPEVQRQPNAFLEVDRLMNTNVPGLFSAGDANGAPFCVAKAMSDGVVAGYSAYEYICVRRTGVKPNLFPYYPYEI